MPGWHKAGPELPGAGFSCRDTSPGGSLFPPGYSVGHVPAHCRQLQLWGYKLLGTFCLSLGVKRGGGSFIPAAAFCRAFIPEDAGWS